jgi:hypothetical protein
MNDIQVNCHKICSKLLDWENGCDGHGFTIIQADADASEERQVTESVIPFIEGKIADSKCVAGGIPFRNLDHLTDGTLVPGNPDRGARPEQLDRRI